MLDTDLLPLGNSPATDRCSRPSLSRRQVPLRDGSHLAGQLYRPGTSVGRTAVGTFPGIVYEYTAYADSAEAFGAMTSARLRRRWPP